MTVYPARRTSRVRVLVAFFALAVLACFAANYFVAFADDDSFRFWSGNLVVSRSVYDNKASNVQVGQILPPGCATTTGGCAAPTGAIADGTYPYVWNNDTYDASFGITSKIYLDQITPFGQFLNSLEVPNILDRHSSSSSNQLVTSFSSKSEMALNLSTDGSKLTFVKQGAAQTEPVAV